MRLNLIVLARLLRLQTTRDYFALTARILQVLPAYDFTGNNECTAQAGSGALTAYFPWLELQMLAAQIARANKKRFHQQGRSFIPSDSDTHSSALLWAR